MKKRVWVILATLGLCLAAVATAQGQGFMVKPMKIEVAARAGKLTTIPLELGNTDGGSAKTLDLSLVELTQGRDGGWVVVEPGSGHDTTGLSSCLKWLRLGSQNVMLQPLERTLVDVGIEVPRKARGSYFAALLVATRPKTDGPGITLKIRFAIPIIVEIEGRPVRQKVRLSDVGMMFQKHREQQGATTFVSMGIANEGQTYSGLKGRVKVEKSVEGKWQPVATADLKEVGIIPGVQLNLTADLNRRLPSGKYRLRGTLYVDGRRVRPYEKEIVFSGDPTVTKLAVDSALTLDPPELLIKGAPGARRTALIRVENASDETVQIETAAVIPPTLRGVGLGNLKGTDLSCAPWVQVLPPSFTLRGGGRQNVRVMASMPKDGQAHANYYGKLVLRAFYPDGQSAGTTTSLVNVGNARVEAQPAAQVVKTSLAIERGAKYVVRTRFSNIGNVHFAPSCRAAVVSGRGRTLAEVELSGNEGLMLPLEIRDFSGIIDFSKIKSGNYLLKTYVDYASGEASVTQLPIRVTGSGEGRQRVFLGKAP